MYSRARPGDHHHRVGAEEEREQGPSDGPDGCGGVLRRGVQSGGQGEGLQLCAGRAAGGEDGWHNCTDDCLPVKRHFELVKRKYCRRNGIKRDGLSQVTINNFIIGVLNLLKVRGHEMGSVGGGGGGGIKRKSYSVGDIAVPWW